MKFLKSLPSVVALAAIMLVSFGATAFAADAATSATDSSSLMDLFKPIYDAFAGGRYAFAAALLVVALVALVKRYLGDKVPWLHSNAGGAALALITASASAVTVALAAPGATVSVDLMESALLVGIGAAGGYSVIKALLVDPILVPYLSKRSWGAPLLAIINFIFNHGSSAGAAAAAAQKEGDAAVIAKPGQGISVIVKPTELK